MSTISLDDLRILDACDPLRSFRTRFALPDDIIYLDGNSLGALPNATPSRLARLVGQEWGKDLIRSWNDNGWIDAPARVGAKIAPLVGAKPHEVVAADSTSVNLYKLIAAAAANRPGRSVILSEPGNFPTDLYVAQGVQSFANGLTLRTAAADDILKAIDETTAVVMLTHVHYKTGRRHDMAAITRAAHAKGALVLWDLSHSAGAIQVDLNGCGADLAVGCGYKYLNGGPGAPAFLFVAERHHISLRSPLSGWMGHARPFDFIDEYEPAQGIARFLCGTPPILSLAALEVGVDLFGDVEMSEVARKGQALCSLFIELVETRCAGFGLELVTPRDAAIRGSHVSLSHPDGYPICQALIERGVIGDFRAPDIIRFGFAPLYVGYENVWHAVDALRTVLESGAWDDRRYRARAKVT